MKRTILSILIIAELCMLTACANNPFTYTSGDTNIGGMFHDIFFGEEQEELSFTLDIKNDTSVKLYSAAISWYVDGEVAGSRGALDAADNYLLLPGQVVTCKFLADDFPDGKLAEVKIDVFVKEAPGDVDFVLCGTLIIPSPIYGQDYPVRLVENEGYSLVSGDASLCFVETQRQMGSQTAENMDLTGPWHLDSEKNNLDAITAAWETFPGYAEWGASMEILSNGFMNWYIGTVGGSCTYSIEGNVLHTAMFAENRSEIPMDMEIAGNDEIKMTYAGLELIWTYGDREDVPANDNEYN